MSDTLLKSDSLLLACMAYTRPEMRTFGHIIRLHSTRSLVVDERASTQTSLLTLPPEMLLHIRSFLQAELVKQLTTDAHHALLDYESTLVEGLCEDCFTWNCDVYGTDVWEWVENGYKNVCDCCVQGVDHRVFSDRKVISMQHYGQLNIKTRRQWLEAYVSQTCFGSRNVWNAINDSILRHFNCVAIPQDPERVEKACDSPQAGRYMLSVPKEGDDFGPKVSIEPVDETSRCDVGFLLNELCIDNGVDANEVAAAERKRLTLNALLHIPNRYCVAGSSQRFAHLLSKRTKPQMSQQGTSFTNNRFLRKLYSTFRSPASERRPSPTIAITSSRTTMLLTVLMSSALVIACQLHS